MNFTRNSIAYKQDGTQVGINEPRFEEGQFGKAVMVEEGTENYLPANIQTWSDYTSNVTTYSITPVSTPYGNGVELSGTSAGRVGKRTSGNINLGTSYAVASVYFKPVTASGVLAIYWDTKDSTGAWQYGTFYSQKINLSNYTSGQWYRLICTANISPNTFASGGTGFFIWAEGTFDVIITAPQLEAKPYPTSFIDGTRSPETLTIPTAGVLNPQEGTISVWVYVNNYLKTNYDTTKQIFWWSSATGRISLGWNVGGRWYAVTGNGTNNRAVSIVDTLSVGWHLFTMRWSATELALLIDGGAQKATAPNPFLPSNVSGSASIGHSRDYVNTLIDDLRISNRAKTDEEILETYGRGL